MIYIVQNILPILAATLAGLLFGIGLYRVFAKDHPLPLVTALIAEFWIAAILAGAIILAPEEAGRWTMAFGTAIVIWSGFVLPALLTSYRQRSIGAGGSVLDAAHWLGVMMIHVGVIEAIGVSAPV